MVHTCDPSTLELEAVESGVQDYSDFIGNSRPAWAITTKDSVS